MVRCKKGSWSYLTQAVFENILLKSGVLQYIQYFSANTIMNQKLFERLIATYCGYCQQSFRTVQKSEKSETEMGSKCNKGAVNRMK